VCGLQLSPQVADVDAAVGRLVGLEAAQRLLELPRRAHGPAAPGLVPGDRDVNEALEEVALVVGRGSPRELERLVRLEEAAGAEIVDSLLVRVKHAL